MVVKQHPRPRDASGQVREREGPSGRAPGELFDRVDGVDEPDEKLSARRLIFLAARLLEMLVGELLL